jgi:hypothetical protein
MPDGSTNLEPSLSPRQRALADAYCRNITEQLGFTHAELAVAAGYAPGNENSLKVIASRTLRLPHVQAYIRNRAREYLAEGGMEVAAALRELTVQREDKRVRLDAAKAVGLAIGLTAREDSGGPGVVLNLMFAGTGAALVQQPGDAAQVIENAAQSRAARSLVQVEGRRPAVRMVTAPPLALAHAQGGVGGGGGDRGGAGEEEGGPPSKLPPETVGVVEEAAAKISRPAKPAKVAGGKGVAKKRTARAKAKKARVVRKPRVKSDV